MFKGLPLNSTSFNTFRSKYLNEIVHKTDKPKLKIFKELSLKNAFKFTNASKIFLAVFFYYATTVNASYFVV